MVTGLPGQILLHVAALVEEGTKEEQEVAKIQHLLVEAKNVKEHQLKQDRATLSCALVSVVQIEKCLRIKIILSNMA